MLAATVTYIAWNRESIQSAKRMHREQTAAEIRANFDPDTIFTALGW